MPTPQPVGGWFKLTLMGVMMVLYSCQSLLITASKAGGSGYQYDPNCAVLMTEFAKALIACTLLLRARAEDPAGTKVTLDHKCLRYAIPALLYAVHNNLVFIGLSYLDAPTYQLLNNIKIIVTGLLYRVFLRKPLRLVQWIGLGVLMLGQMVATLETGGSSYASGFVTGVLIMLGLSCLSGMAGVYNEFLLKGSADSTHWQNLQLYAFSVLFCAAQFLYRSTVERRTASFFHGFDSMTWSVIMCSALMGQAVSFVLKYCDNITNRFATAASLLVTTGASWVLFGTAVNRPFYLGVGLIGMAFVLYFVDHETLVAFDNELKGSKSSSSKDKAQEMESSCQEAHSATQSPTKV